MTRTITVEEDFLIADHNEVLRYNNGQHIADIIRDLLSNGFTSEIKVIGYEFDQSFVATKYDLYVIEEDNVTRTSISNLRAVLIIMDHMWENNNEYKQGE